MNHASWPGVARKPEPRPPEPRPPEPAPGPTPAGLCRAVGRELLAFAVTLAMIAAVLWLIGHVGSAPR